MNQDQTAEMTDSEDTRRDLSYGETSDTYVSGDASGSGSVSRIRGAGASSVRTRPYPQRNGKGTADELYGQTGRYTGREARTRIAGRLRVNDGRTMMGDGMDVDAPRMAIQDLDLLNEERQKQIDIRLLLRAWQNERHAPDILPVCSDLINLSLDLIRSKVCLPALLLR